ncbi:DNA integrity scanning protein DisA nucleotide-binding domain protein [Candidatus Pacearchaeota archaeon]|nr:DNA integrity scanning protein DisA nucleotide-binding domain protein [Candidatus Pacearchaeota archaeon]
MAKNNPEKNKLTREKIEKLLIDIAIKITKDGKGCLFVIKEKEFEYETMIEQDIKQFNVIDYPRRLEALSIIDGACVIDINGNLIAYSAKIKNTKPFTGYGTRHAAAYTSSLNGNTSIMSSEEDRKVKIFKSGVLIMQIDPFEKNIEYKTKEAVNILESIGIGSVASITASTLAPVSYLTAFGISAAAPAGLVLIPGIVVFATTHYILKSLLKKKSEEEKAQQRTIFDFLWNIGRKKNENKV